MCFTFWMKRMGNFNCFLPASQFLAQGQRQIRIMLYYAIAKGAFEYRASDFLCKSQEMGLPVGSSSTFSKLLLLLLSEV